MPVKNLLHRLLQAWHDRATVLKAASFAAVGVVNAMIDFAVFWTAVHQLDLPLVPANVMSWLVAVTNSYVMNSFITFARESGRELRWRAYFTFIGAGLVGLFVNTTVLVLAVEAMPRFIDDPTLQLAAAKSCAILTAFLANFSLSHFVVFRKKSSAP